VLTNKRKKNALFILITKGTFLFPFNIFSLDFLSFNHLIAKYHEKIFIFSGTFSVQIILLRKLCPSFIISRYIDLTLKTLEAWIFYKKLLDTSHSPTNIGLCTRCNHDGQLSPVNDLLVQYSKELLLTPCYCDIFSLNNVVWWSILESKCVIPIPSVPPNASFRPISDIKGLFVWAGCGWLQLAVVLCRESCCVGKADVLSFTLW
jgi:hypothetical protein